MRSAAGVVALLTLLVWAPAPSRSQSAPGNALNPTADDTTRVVDERGMTQFRTTRRRSPTGFLYPYPLEPNSLSELGGGWYFRGSGEAGGITSTGDRRETRFEQYADWNRGGLVNFFDLSWLHPESGFTLEAAGGSVGREDQYYYGEAGLLGKLRLRGSFSGIPHTFAKDARNLFEGAGTPTLELPDPLVPGADNDLEAALESVGESTLTLTRDQTRIALDFRAHDRLNLFGRYDYEDRHGKRPFGGSLVYEVSERLPAHVAETTEPISHRTHNFSAGAQYTGKRLQGNLAYNGSLFRNGKETLTWDNPFLTGLLPGALNVERGRFDLTPDNEWHNARGDLAFSLPWNGRFNTTLSFGHMHQDETLLPPTVNSGLVGSSNVNQVDLEDWNTRSALPRHSGNAEVDTFLANARLRFRPWKPLRLAVRFRFYDRDNDTRYTAFNPSTSQIGYIAEDGAFHVVPPPGSRVFVPGQATEDFHYRAIPFGYQKLLAEATGDYRVGRKSNLGLRYSWEQIDRDHRERSKTWEHRVRAAFASRDLAWSTWRVSYEFADRRGSGYDPFPYRAFYVSGLDANDPVCAGLDPGQDCFAPIRDSLPPFTLAQLRKHDLSSRDQHLARLRTNFLIREDMDLALVGNLVFDDHDADYGLKARRGGSVNVEWSYQPSPRFNGYAFGTFNKRWRKMANINDVGPRPDSSDPNAGGEVFPLENEWTLEVDETSGAVGAGFWVRPIGPLTIESSYRFLRSDQELDYDFASQGALAPDPSVPADQAGSRFPDLRTEDHVIQTDLRLELREGIALRFFHRYWHSSIRDFQQKGLTPLGVEEALFLGHVDRNFHVHVFGATLQLRL